MKFLFVENKKLRAICSYLTITALFLCQIPFNLSAQGLVQTLYQDDFSGAANTRWEVAGDGNLLISGSLPQNGTGANVWAINNTVSPTIDNTANLHVSCLAGNCGNAPGQNDLVKFDATLPENSTNRAAYMKQDFPASAFLGGNLQLQFDWIFRKTDPTSLDAGMRLIYSLQNGNPGTWKEINQTFFGSSAAGIQTSAFTINTTNFPGFDINNPKLRVGFRWFNKAPAVSPNPAIDNAIIIDNVRIRNYPTLVFNSVSPTSICTGSNVTIIYQVSGFATGTSFAAQLSDLNGSFASPTFLGNLPQTTFQVTIPVGLPSSANYKIRIESSNGFLSNELPLNIIEVPDKPFAGGDAAECSGKTLNIGGGAAQPGVTYSWNVPALGANLAPTINITNTGNAPTKLTYILFATRGICINRDTVILTANPNPIVDAGIPFSICDNEDPVLLVGLPATTLATATPSGTGVWTGAGLTGAGNATFFNPSGLNGAQTLVYTYSQNWKNGGPACEAKANRVITVKQAPIVQAGDPETYCNQAAVQNFAGTFTPPNGTWSGPGITNPAGLFNPNSLNIGIHVCTLSVTNNGCTQTDTKTITITPTLVANAGLDTLALCSYKKTHTMTGFSPPLETFGKWTSKPLATLIQPGGTLNFDTVNEGSHTLYYTYDKDKCRTVDSVKLTIIKARVARSGPSLEVCSNDSCFVLTGQYPSGGEWSGLGVDTSGTVFCPSKATVGPKLIKYRVNYSNGCFSEAIRTVLVNPSPNINIGPNDTICASQKVKTITNFQPTGGIWTGPGMTSAGDFNTGDSLLGNITIRYTVTNATGCSAFKQKQITVQRLPRAKAGLDSATCTGFPLTIGGDTIPNLLYKWFEPIPGSIAVDTASFATVLLTNPKQVVDSFFVKLYVKDTITKCENRDTVRIYVYPEPDAIAIFPGIKTKCFGDTFEIKAKTRKGLTYEWLRNGLSLNNPNEKDSVLLAPTSGKYQLVVRNLGAPCTDTSLVDSLSIFPRFIPQIKGHLKFCKDSTTQLNVVPVLPGFTYEWQYNRKNVPDSIATTFTVGKTGTVRVILRTDKGCRDSSAIANIDSLPVPTTGILNDTVICENQKAIFKAPVDSLYQYRWIDSSTKAVISTNDTLFTAKAGKYYLQVYNFCKVATDSVVLLRVNPLPRFGILNNGRNDTTVCVGLPVKLFGPNGYESYTWTTDTSAAGSSNSKLYAMPTDNLLEFKLALEVTDQFGCSNSDTVAVKIDECPPVIYIPNAFSPQGDKINDLWRITGYSISEVKIYVFNRWGQMVFYSEDIDKPWDGNFNGTPCLSGVYKYLIEYKGAFDGEDVGKKETGTITIIR